LAKPIDLANIFYIYIKQYSTEKMRQKNRRVEIEIIEVDPLSIGLQAGEK